MMIDHEHTVAHRFEHVTHRAQLGPGTRIEHDEEIAVGEIGRLHLLGQRLDFPVGIDPLQTRGRGLGIDDPDMLAERLEDAGHAQLAAEGVAVGADVAGEHHTVGLPENLQQTGPVESHLVSIPIGVESWRRGMPSAHAVTQADVVRR